jgi:hypothetical protein
MKRLNLTKVWAVVATLALGAVILVACTPNSISQQAAENANSNFSPYQIKNWIEQKYYSWRLQISDDPSLIVWCTMFPSTPGVKPITIPIVGKLVSSNKRPYASSSSGEVIDAQGMYGSSSEFRYGFGPTGMQEYYEITDLPMFCTTQPMVWQTQLTVMVQAKNNPLLAASQQAHDLIAAGKLEEAQQVLDAAILASQEGGQ